MKSNYIFTEKTYDLMFSHQQNLDISTRKTRGAFYTPYEISTNMWARVLKLHMLKRISDVNFIEWLFGDSKSKTFDELQKYKFINELLEIKWIDMSAGSGCFAYSFLLICERLLGKLNERIEIYVDKLSDNIYLNDIDEIASCRTIQIFNQDLDISVKFNHINNVDALTQLHKNPDILNVLKTGGFDIVIGNPPYLGERSNREVFRKYKQDASTAEIYSGKMDLLYFFIYRGVEYLKENGLLGYITTQYFDNADSAKMLRSYLKSSVNFEEIHIDDYSKKFDALSTISLMIFICSKKKFVDETNIKCMLKVENEQYIIEQKDLYDEYGKLRLEKRDEKFYMATNMRKKSKYKLEDFFDVNQGIVSGADRLTRLKSRKFKIFEEFFKENTKQTKAIFVYTKDEMLEIIDNYKIDRKKAKEIFKPFIKGSYIKREFIETGNLYILYSKQTNIGKCEGILKYLENFKTLLEDRREVRLGYRKWYELQWGRNQEMFEKNKILIPSRSLDMRACISDEAIYASADVYYISLKQKFYKNAKQESEALKRLCEYLNTMEVENWFRSMGKKKGRVMELYATPIKQLPLNFRP